MPVTTNETLTVCCDNPSCPNVKALPAGLAGDELDGWLLVTVEKHGYGVQHGTFCTFSCAAVVADAQAQAEQG